MGKHQSSVRLAWIALFAASLLFLSTCSVASSGDLEGFDEEESAPPPSAIHVEHASVSETAPDTAEASTDQKASHEQSASSPATAPEVLVPVYAKYILEVLSAALIVLYIVIMGLGIRSNRAIAEAWAKAFTFKGGIFDKNFSSLGPNSDAVLMKDSFNIYKFYATGRRHCQGLLAELILLPRQDALSMVWNLLSPTEDLIRIDVYMTEESMPPIVLAIATPKHARALQRDSKDIIKYTKRITVGKELEKMWVLAEHSSIFHDLFSDPKILQLLSSAGPHASSLKYFRSMHFSSENSESSHKRVLRFTFKLPPAPQMGEISRLMDLIPTFIDVVGTYKLPAELKKRALESRVKQEEDEEEQRRKRVEAIQQKKMEKAQEERARVLRMTPEARQKYEEKMQRQNAKKAMKTKMLRM